jgi:putative glutamine amidotransferase
MIGRPILAITQRVAVDPATGERRDALDQRWAAFADAAGVQLIAMPNSGDAAVRLLQALPCAGLILSGGNNIGREMRPAGGRALETAGEGTAPERDRTESALLAAAIDADMPVLGVCRGFQALNVFHGGDLREMPHGHVATRHNLRFSAGEQALAADANSYHDWGMTDADMATSIEVLAWADEVVEMGRHRTLPHLGVMWHPEREAPFRRCDLDLVRMHFGLCEAA